jgi:Leucine-rich repeat (LRR) protein
LCALRVLAIANPVRALPDLRALDRLESIELSGELGEVLFERLPTSLEAIRGYGSHRVGIARIPPAIARFRRLRTLELAFERLDTLAPELRDLPLETLVLSSTLLADTPTYAHLPATLRTLELANVGMTHVPPRIFELVNLRTLVLAANRLAELPPAIARLGALEKLSVEGNQLATLPEEVGALAHLRVLQLRANRLAALPASLARLVELEALDVVANRLTSIPSAIRALPKLRRLEAAAQVAAGDRR